MTLSMNEQTRNPQTTPGRAATLAVTIIFALYLLVAVAVLMFAGIGTGVLGLGNEDIQGHVFAAFAGPVLGPFAIVMSLAVLSASAAFLRPTLAGPTRTMLAMGHHHAFPKRFGTTNPRFKPPGFATVVAGAVAWGFSAVMRVLSTDSLTDTLLALGILISFSYGVTSLACVCYFRSEALASVRSLLLKFAAPLLGGLGLVFNLALVLILSSVVLMFVMNAANPVLFHGNTLRTGSSRDD